MRGALFAHGALSRVRSLPKKSGSEKGIWFEPATRQAPASSLTQFPSLLSQSASWPLLSASAHPIRTTMDDLEIAIRTGGLDAEKHDCCLTLHTTTKSHA